MVGLDDAVHSTLWQPGSSCTYDFSDAGGLIRIQPSSNVLTIIINDSLAVEETIFNGSIGQVVFELPYSGSSQTGLFLKGDSATITSQSGASISQLCIENGVEHPEIQLRFRPAVSYVSTGLEDSRRVNNIRIFVVNLNSSQSIALQGSLPLRISCTDTQFTSQKCIVSSETENLVITSTLNGNVGHVSVPILTTTAGAAVNVEIVVCNITIERWLR